MSKPRSTLPIAAMLLLCLSACSAVSTRPAAPDLSARAALRPACPTPTPASTLGRIAGEIAAGIKAGAPPNTLSTEWERLDEAARKCRGA